MTGLWQDLRQGVRILSKQPGFATVTVLTLALGIGANTAIFTLVHALMLKSLPVEKPEQLYRLGDDDKCCVVTGLLDSFSLFSYPLYRQLQQGSPEFTELAAFQAHLLDLSVRQAGDSAIAEPFRGELVSGNYFSMFGVQPFVGRLLTPSDDRVGASPVAVMSYRTWKVHYGSNPSLIGGSVSINGVPVTIVGIAAPEFFGDTVRDNPAEFWIPLGTEPALRGQSSILQQPSAHWLYAIGRLDPSVRPLQAQIHLTAELQAWLAGQTFIPERYRNRIARQHIVIAPAGGGVAVMRINHAAALRVLFVVSGLVLLIACANVANLMLARVNVAQTAVRAALGASRQRLVRHAFTDGAVLALVGGLAGLVVAFAGTRLLLLLAFPGSTHLPIDAKPSLFVLGFALVLSMITGLLFSVAPAAMMSGTNPADALHGIGRSTRDRSLFSRKALVIAQAALSLALLVGAGLLTESLRNLQRQAFGYQTQGLVLATVDPLLAGYAPNSLESLYAQLHHRLGQIPGVVSVGFSLYGPMSGDNWSGGIAIEGRPNDPDHRDSASWNRVSGQFFQTIGTRLLRGRLIDDTDTPASVHVTVINQSFATKFFANVDPLRRHFGIGDAAHAGDFEIVGVVEDAKYQSADGAPRPMFFLPLLQRVAYTDQSDALTQTRASYAHDIQLRVAGRPDRLEAAIRQALGEINPNLALLNLSTFDERLLRSVGQERLIARLTLLYGLLALALASVGLYGVTAYSVTRRTSEIGIRIALGAARTKVVGIVLRDALSQVGFGLVLGMPLALAVGRGLSHQLYGVSPSDPWAFGAALVLLIASAIVAAWVPARQAASIDPMAALRTD